MGCRHSRSDELEDMPVEAIQYRKRSSKLWKLSRRKKSKKSIKSASSGRTAKSNSRRNSDTEGDDGGVDRMADRDSSGNFVGVTVQSSPTPSGKLSSPDAKNKTAKLDKNTNERSIQMFGGNNKSIKNVLSLSVDNTESPDVAEPKHARFGRTSVFPIWESSFSEPCKCVNMDVNHPPSECEVSTNSKLCRRCSQTVETVQNNLRGMNLSNNNSGSNGNGGGGGNGGVMTSDSVSPGDGPSTGGNNSNHEAKNSQLAAIANLLVLAALDLSAPASSLLVKNRKNAWIQLAGHPGAFAPAGPNTIWKKRIAKENYELLAYQALNEFPCSRSIMPAFYREVEFNGEYFIEMEDLLNHFNDPSIMDIKMGHRTFLEAEVKNPVLRKDLFEKMIKLDASAPTADERAQSAITKLRYMQFREHESSTSSLGFRIEAIRMSGDTPNTNLKKVKSRDEVSYFIKKFTKGHESAIPPLCERLKDIREKFESIPFFHRHEIIGSSLLIMYDSSNHAGAWMIDFAKTIPVPDLKLNHRSAWQLGNHEDGYLFGLDNLIQIFDSIVETQDKEINCDKGSSETTDKPEQEENPS